MEQAINLAADLFQVGAEVLQDMGGDPLTFHQQSQQQVLGADVVVAHPAGFLEGDLDHLLHP